MKLSANQITKGQRHLNNARHIQYHRQKQLVNYLKGMRKDLLNCSMVVNDIKQLKTDIEESRIRVAELERKYI